MGRLRCGGRRAVEPSQQLTPASSPNAEAPARQAPPTWVRRQTGASASFPVLKHTPRTAAN